MRYLKIPRKLKKRFKKQVLSSFSTAYIKYRGINLSRIKILYYDTEREAVGFEINNKR